MHAKQQLKTFADYSCESDIDMGGVLEMTAMSMVMPLLGALWPLTALAKALFCTLLFSVYATIATKLNQ